jgi:hypothetical protein
MRIWPRRTADRAVSIAMESCIVPIMIVNLAAALLAVLQFLRPMTTPAAWKELAMWPRQKYSWASSGTGSLPFNVQLHGDRRG